MTYMSFHNFVGKSGSKQNGQVYTTYTGTSNTIAITRIHLLSTGIFPSNFAKDDKKSLIPNQTSSGGGG